MTSSPSAGISGVPPLLLLPLLPLRPPFRDQFGNSSSSGCEGQPERSHLHQRNDPDSSQTSRDRATIPSSGLREDQTDVSWNTLALTRTAADKCLDHRLGQATTALLDGQVGEAVALLQRAHSWRNRWEEETSQSLPLKPEHWMTMSACSMVVGDDDTAALFAVRVRESANSDWTVDLTREFRNSSADATALLAVNRLRQRRPDRAASLLEIAITDHRLIGDLEQLVADHLLHFLCQDAAGQASAAMQSLRTASRLLNQSLDETRHHRAPQLRRWLKRHGQPRPLLMKTM